MGDTISSLVFRPPKPTPIHPSEYFYLDVDVHSPLCTNKALRRANGGTATSNSCDDQHGSCASAMCLDTGESDLASLDASYIGRDPNNPAISLNCAQSNFGGTTLDPRQHNVPSGTVPNMRNGQIYKVPAFFIRRRNATQTLLFSHGNAEDLGMMYNRMKDLAMVLGVNIMAYDYTGYGLSIPGPAHGNSSNASDNSGSNEGPSENMIYRNIEAAFHYLTQVRKIPPHQIILYGRSLGSGPSCYLAAKTALNGQSVGGLILHSPFLSVYKVVADLNGLDLGLVGDLFHNEKRVKNVRCPTLIIHGKQDEVVPFWHAPRLLAAVPPEFRAQPFYVEGMGHNHIESRCREQYVKVVVNFLRMGVWQNNRALSEQPNSEGCTNHNNGSRTNSPSTAPLHRGPSPIPIHERALPSETKENASFYVNKTWLRHAKVLLKEVFSDAGCYVNSVSEGNDSRWEARSTANQSGSGRSSGSGSRSRKEKNNEQVDRYNKGLADARDDEDEFAPWRGNGNNAQRRKSANSSGSTGNGSSQQRHRYAQSAPEKILTARPDGHSNNSRPSSPNNSQHQRTTGRQSPGVYRKAQSHSAMDSVGQQQAGHIDMCTVKTNSPRTNFLSQQQKNRGYGKSKSMALLEGMSRQKRF